LRLVTVEKVYSPRSPLRDPRGFLASAHADLARSVRLGGRLAAANLRATYRRSWLGYLSLILPAVAATGVALVLSQQRVLTIRALPIPYAAFVISGTVLWQLFVEVVNAPLQRLRAYRHVISRSAIPHESFILAGVERRSPTRRCASRLPCRS
jgi:lipopolysaccharide transport system permease protein